MRVDPIKDIAALLRVSTPLLFLLSLLACGPRATPAREAHEDEIAQKSSQEAHDEIELSEEAIVRAGIRIARVKAKIIEGGVSIPAEIRFDPSSTAHVGPLVPGRITEVAAALGDRVKKGESLGVVSSGDVSTARARLDQARAQLAAAEATRARQELLSSEGIGARRTLIDAEARVGELRAEVEGIRRQLSVFGSKKGGEITLLSPIDGVVVAVHATLGETASPDEPAFIVTDPTRIWVRGQVPELEIERVNMGSAALVRLHAFPDLVMRGEITYVAPALDEATRSLPIRVTLDAPDPRLRSGLFGSIELLESNAEEAVPAIPASAIATLDGQTIVFVPAHEPGRFRVRAITLGRRAGRHFEIREGLTIGEPFVESGAFTLKSVLRKSELSEGHAH